MKHKWIDTGLSPDFILDHPHTGLLMHFRILLLFQKTCFIFVAIYYMAVCFIHHAQFWNVGLLGMWVHGFSSTKSAPGTAASCSLIKRKY